MPDRGQWAVPGESRVTQGSVCLRVRLKGPGIRHRGAMLPTRFQYCRPLGVRWSLFVALALTAAACTAAPAVTTTTAAATATTTTSAPSPSTTREPRDSSILSITLSLGELTLSGEMPDEAARDALLAVAQSTVGEENVTDSLEVGRRAGSTDLAPALEALNGIVAELPTWFDAAELRLRGTNLTVTGDGLSPEALEQATTFLDSTTGLTVTSELEISPVVQSREDVKALLENETITFATGSAEITEEGIAVLERVIDLLAPAFAARPRVEVRIDGHTDDQGTEEFNRDLSLRRAQAVLDYMVAAGLPDANLTPQGFGESRPIADNATEEGRAKNRRIEFTLEG
jgi:OOP family OmpA-OmpF porin